MKYKIRYNPQFGGGTTEMTVDAESQWQAKKIFEAMLPRSQVIDVSEIREPAPRSPWLDGYSTPNPQPQPQAKKSSGILPFIAAADLGYVAGRATEPDTVFIAPGDEGTGSQSWWAQRAQASLASPTREAELSFFEETVTSACRVLSFFFRNAGKCSSERAEVGPKSTSRLSD